MHSLRIVRGDIVKQIHTSDTAVANYHAAQLKHGKRGPQSLIDVISLFRINMRSRQTEPNRTILRSLYNRDLVTKAVNNPGVTVTEGDLSYTYTYHAI